EPGRSPAADPVELYRTYLRQQLASVVSSEKRLNELYRHEYDDARALTKYEIDDEVFRADIARKQRLFDGIVKRLNDADLVKEVGGYDAKLISKPQAGKKYWP